MARKKPIFNLSASQLIYISGSFILLVFLIYSCKKELSNAAADTINDATVSQAKTWYMQTYSQANLSKNVKRTLDLNTGTADSTFNYTEFTGPDWNHAVNYTRFNADVLELPTDPNRDVIGTSLGSFPGSQPIYKNKYSRSSFLLLKDSTGYHGYVMTIIADSAYINNDLSKLDKNKYNNRDANFSGVLIYNTPDGLPVSGWIYKNGEIIKQMQLSNNKGRDSSTNNARILLNNNISRLAYHSSKLLEVYEYCQPFYVTVTTKDNNGNVVSSVTTTQGQVCNYEFVDVPTGGTGGNSAPATTGGGGAASPATSPCTVPAANTLVSVTNPNHKTTLVVQYVEGSGFPAPTSTTSAPCNTTTTTTTNQTTPVTQLMKNPNALTPAQIAALQALLNQITNSCIGKALINSLTAGGHKFDFSINSTTNVNVPAAYSPVNNSIQMNDPSQVSSNSLMEELFHAYQNYTYPGGTAQYAGKAGSANIEFEFKVLYDMNSSINTNGGTYLGATTSNYDNYIGWIGNLTNYSSLPAAFTSSQQTYYFLYMNEFIHGNSNYSSTIINYSLNPSAMFSLINSSPCSKK